MANTPRQKSLKLILPRSLGSKHFTSFSTFGKEKMTCVRHHEHLKGPGGMEGGGDSHQLSQKDQLRLFTWGHVIPLCLGLKLDREWGWGKGGKGSRIEDEEGRWREVRRERR